MSPVAQGRFFPQIGSQGRLFGRQSPLAAGLSRTRSLGPGMARIRLVGRIGARPCYLLLQGPSHLRGWSAVSASEPLQRASPGLLDGIVGAPEALGHARPTRAVEARLDYLVLQRREVAGANGEQFASRWRSAVTPRPQLLRPALVW